MQTIQMRERTGTDGTLTVRIPLGRPDTEFDVVLVVQPKGTAGRGWPPGYFDLFGSVDDETFVVHPQPQLPPPADADRRAAVDAFRGRLAASGRDFGDSVQDIREGRDR